MHVLEGLAGQVYWVGCFANGNINSAQWCHGLVSVTDKEIVWTGFINETWTFQGEALEQATTGKVFECAAGQAPNTSPFCKLEADTAIETSEFDITTKEWLYFAGGAPVACRIICNPTDAFQYSIRRKDTGSVVLNHFNMRNKKILFPGATITTAGLVGNAIGIDNTQYLRCNGAISEIQLPLSQTLSFPFANLELTILSGQIQTVGLQLQAPFLGTFVANSNNDGLDWSGSVLSAVKFPAAHQLEFTPDGTHLVVLSAVNAMGIMSDIGETFVYGGLLEPGKYNNQELLRKELERTLNGYKTKNGSKYIVTSNGNGFDISMDGASGLPEKLRILSERQAQPFFPGQPLYCANKWLGITGDTTLVTVFQCGPVHLPRDINSLYLHSDTLAGFRDTMGPMPNTRGTVAKISLGNTKFMEYHTESLYRPHLYSTLPLSTISRIDFSLRDSRGVAQSLENTNFAFVVTFDTSHLAL